MSDKSINNGERLVALETRMGAVQGDIKEVKKMVGDLTDKIDKFSIALTKVETLEDKISGLEKQIVKLEGVNSIKNTFLWVGLVASAIINIVVIYQLFSGGN